MSLAISPNLVAELLKTAQVADVLSKPVAVAADAVTHTVGAGAKAIGKPLSPVDSGAVNDTAKFLIERGIFDVAGGAAGYGLAKLFRLRPDLIPYAVLAGGGIGGAGHSFYTFRKHRKALDAASQA